MVMSAKTQFWIAVIGLSGRENGDSFQGPGKSCLCDKFMYPDKPVSPGHTSIVSQQDFHGPIINTDHFLYWGRTRRTVDGKMVEFNIIEQTEFLDDVSFTPFNARDPYIKRGTSTTINSSRKIQYISSEQLQDPKSCKSQKFASRKLHIDGFLCVYDVSKVSDRAAGTQYKFVFELLDLIDVPVVLVATKCDKGRSRHFEEMMYLAKVQKVPIVETSALENVNVAQAFFSLVRIFNRQVIISKKHIQYFNPKEAGNKKKGKKEKKQDKKKKSLKTKLDKIPSPPARRGDGSLNSKNDSETSGEWATDLRPPSNEQSLFPTPRDSPLTGSLLSEPPYEHINGEDHLPLYENCHDSHGSRDSATNQSQPDSESRDSQLSKSDSLQSKTSSDEYIPVPRAPYDPAENYENVRYHQRPGVQIPAACPSPTSHSSDSERGFLTGVPEHMKSFTSQRPWETQWNTYSNITIEPPPIQPRAVKQLSDHASSETHSSVDTDSQANLRFGRQLTITEKKHSIPVSVSSYSNAPLLERNTHCSGSSMMSESRASSAEQYIVPQCEIRIAEVSDDGSDEMSDNEHDLPPYPVSSPPPPPTDPRYHLNNDLDEMNTLVGEISSLVWQNEPLPPPPDAYFLAPNGPIPDFEKTPTNELASPNLFRSNDNGDKDKFNYPINDVFESDDAATCYENVQPELPPRQPSLPPRPNLPQRIPLSDAAKWTPALPPRQGEGMTSCDTSPQSRDVPSHDVPPRNSTRVTVPLPPRNPDTMNNPPRESKRHELMFPPRIPFPRAGPGNTRNTEGMRKRPHDPPKTRYEDNHTNHVPHLPPRITHPEYHNSGLSKTLPPPRHHIPTRIPLPPRNQTTRPMYSEVDKNSGVEPQLLYNNMQHDFSPYVVPTAPKLDRWEEYNNCIEHSTRRSGKKKVKVKIPQR